MKSFRNFSKGFVGPNIDRSAKRIIKIELGGGIGKAPASGDPDEGAQEFLDGNFPCNPKIKSNN
jgi:hypothetical protein